MPNYNESNVSGTKYTRSPQVRISNPLGGVPSIQFKEEDVVVTDDGNVVQPKGALHESLTDPSVTFDVLNPLDDSVLTTATYQDVYNMIYSLYRHLAGLRDAAEEE